MKIYQFRVSIIGVPNIYRIIEASENNTFDDLHQTIFDSFDRYDPHLYSFFITKKDTNNLNTIYNSPEITHPENVRDFFGFKKKSRSTETTQIQDAGLVGKDVFHYLFDFGDDWWHRIRVQSIKETAAKGKIIHIKKAVGESPPQYPDYDEFDDEDEYD